jgi:hypothetical protein
MPDYSPAAIDGFTGDKKNFGFQFNKTKAERLILESIYMRTNWMGNWRQNKGQSGFFVFLKELGRPLECE